MLVRDKHVSWRVHCDLRKRVIRIREMEEDVDKMSRYKKISKLYI